MDIDYKGEERRLTLLHYAALANDVPSVKLLLDNDANVDIKDKNGWTALMFASDRNKFSIVEILLRNGADPDVLDTKGRTALVLASMHGHAETIKLLMQYNADPDFQENPSGRSSLEFLSYEGRTDLVKLLLEHKANPNLRNKAAGRTALAVASRVGHLPVVKLLLKYEADPNIQDNNKMTVLMHASYKGYTDIVKLLLKHKADPNLRDDEGKTVLMRAAFWGYTEIIKALLENGANPDIEDKNGWTVMKIALNRDYPQIVKLLSEHKKNSGTFQQTAGTVGTLHSSIDTSMRISAPVKRKEPEAGTSSGAEKKKPKVLVEYNFSIDGLIGFISYLKTLETRGIISTEEKHILVRQVARQKAVLRAKLKKNVWVSVQESDTGIFIKEQVFWGSGKFLSMIDNSMAGVLHDLPFNETKSGITFTSFYGYYAQFMRVWLVKSRHVLGAGKVDVSRVWLMGFQGEPPYKRYDISYKPLHPSIPGKEYLVLSSEQPINFRSLRRLIFENESSLKKRLKEIMKNVKLPKTYDWLSGVDNLHFMEGDGSIVFTTGWVLKGQKPWSWIYNDPERSEKYKTIIEKNKEFFAENLDKNHPVYFSFIFQRWKLLPPKEESFDLYWNVPLDVIFNEDDLKSGSIVIPRPTLRYTARAVVKPDIIGAPVKRKEPEAGTSSGAEKKKLKQTAFHQLVQKSKELKQEFYFVWYGYKKPEELEVLLEPLWQWYMKTFIDKGLIKNENLRLEFYHGIDKKTTLEIEIRTDQNVPIVSNFDDIEMALKDPRWRSLVKTVWSMSNHIFRAEGAKGFIDTIKYTVGKWSKGVNYWMYIVVLRDDTKQDVLQRIISRLGFKKTKKTVHFNVIDPYLVRTDLSQDLPIILTFEEVPKTILAAGTIRSVENIRRRGPLTHWLDSLALLLTILYTKQNINFALQPLAKEKFKGGIVSSMIPEVWSSVARTYVEIEKNDSIVWDSTGDVGGILKNRALTKLLTKITHFPKWIAEKIGVTIGRNKAGHFVRTYKFTESDMDLFLVYIGKLKSRRRPIISEEEEKMLIHYVVNVRKPTFALYSTQYMRPQRREARTWLTVEEIENGVDNGVLIFEEAPWALDFMEGIVDTMAGIMHGEDLNRVRSVFGIQSNLREGPRSLNVERIIQPEGLIVKKFYKRREVEFTISLKPLHPKMNPNVKYLAMSTPVPSNLLHLDVLKETMVQNYNLFRSRLIDRMPNAKLPFRGKGVIIQIKLLGFTKDGYAHPLSDPPTKKELLSWKTIFADKKRDKKRKYKKILKIYDDFFFSGVKETRRVYYSLIFQRYEFLPPAGEMVDIYWDIPLDLIFKAGALTVKAKKIPVASMTYNTRSIMKPTIIGEEQETTFDHYKFPLFGRETENEKKSSNSTYNHISEIQTNEEIMDNSDNQSTSDDASRIGLVATSTIVAAGSGSGGSRFTINVNFDKLGFAMQHFGTNIQKWRKKLRSDPEKEDKMRTKVQKRWDTYIQWQINKFVNVIIPPETVWTRDQGQEIARLFREYMQEWKVLRTEALLVGKSEISDRMKEKVYAALNNLEQYFLSLDMDTRAQKWNEWATCHIETPKRTCGKLFVWPRTLIKPVQKRLGSGYTDVDLKEKMPMLAEVQIGQPFPSSGYTNSTNLSEHAQGGFVHPMRCLAQTLATYSDSLCYSDPRLQEAHNRNIDACVSSFVSTSNDEDWRNVTKTIAHEIGNVMKILHSSGEPPAKEDVNPLRDANTDLLNDLEMHDEKIAAEFSTNMEEFQSNILSSVMGDHPEKERRRLFQKAYTTASLVGSNLNMILKEDGTDYEDDEFYGHRNVAVSTSGKATGLFNSDDYTDVIFLSASDVEDLKNKRELEIEGVGSRILDTKDLTSENMHVKFVLTPKAIESGAFSAQQKGQHLLDTYGNVETKNAKDSKTYFTGKLLGYGFVDLVHADAIADPLGKNIKLADFAPEEPVGIKLRNPFRKFKRLRKSTRRIPTIKKDLKFHEVDRATDRTFKHADAICRVPAFEANYSDGQNKQRDCEEGEIRKMRFRGLGFVQVTVDDKGDNDNEWSNEFARAPLIY